MGCFSPFKDNFGVGFRSPNRDTHPPWKVGPKKMDPYSKNTWYLHKVRMQRKKIKAGIEWKILATQGSTNSLTEDDCGAWRILNFRFVDWSSNFGHLMSSKLGHHQSNTLSICFCEWIICSETFDGIFSDRFLVLEWMELRNCIIAIQNLEWFC